MARSATSRSTASASGARTSSAPSLKALLDDGAVAIVFDLRDNPGGYIDAAQKIASEFIGSGLIFSQESSGGDKKDWESTGDGLATDPKLPLAVLVNGGSASASEIVAAALKESGRGVIIGEPTYGKNTVQVWTELVDHSGVRITISRWFTPDHNSVAPDGVQPDVIVARPRRDTGRPGSRPRPSHHRADGSGGPHPVAAGGRVGGHCALSGRLLASGPTKGGGVQ